MRGAHPTTAKSRPGGRSYQALVDHTLHNMGSSRGGADVCSGAANIEAVELVVPHDAFGDSHGALFGHVAVRDLRFESVGDFSPRLDGVRHRAGGPLGVDQRGFLDVLLQIRRQISVSHPFRCHGGFSVIFYAVL